MALFSPWRADFPALAVLEAQGQTYLDSAATAQKPQALIDAGLPVPPELLAAAAGAAVVATDAIADQAADTTVPVADAVAMPATPAQELAVEPAL